MTNFRSDRILTLYFFYPLVKKTFFTHKPSIPILMYHSISEKKEDTVHPYYCINTTPEIFYTHMIFLRENSYSVINLNEALQILRKPTYPSKRYAVITFDDGYRDFYNEAFPILKDYGYTATVFLPTGYISDNRLSFKKKGCLTWDEVRQLHNQGISFGSHSITHSELQSLKYNDLQYEIQKSKETIENKIGAKVESFCYPSRFPEEKRNFIIYLRNLLRKNGYGHGVSTRIGTTSQNDDSYFMKRIPINSMDDISFLKAKLEDGYNWLYHIQRLKKIFM